jgi:hypothetical protein
MRVETASAVSGESNVSTRKRAAKPNTKTKNLKTVYARQLTMLLKRNEEKQTKQIPTDMYTQRRKRNTWTMTWTSRGR